MTSTIDRPCMSQPAASHALRRRAARCAAAFALGSLLAACGGGGSDSGTTGGSGSTPPPGAPTSAVRAAAATTTSQSSSNACAPIQPFYWEIGDRTADLVSGSVASAGSSTVITSTTPMSIASASKWVYATYFVQRQSGILSDADIKFMTFTSGYTDFSQCSQGQTVQQCVNSDNNNVYAPAADGKFSYGGGHMEKHASLNGLGPLANAPLAAEIMSQIGSDAAIAYSQPLLAGGIVTTADHYAVLLRGILAGTMKMHDALGTHAVCTNPQTCPTALATPIPQTVSWHYSIGHWVEDDPVTGDGAFSSAGAFGFYPWIDAGKTTYGIIARTSGAGSGFDSAQCGALIRKAWATGTAQ